MTIDINKNSALIDSGYSGCGCGNRRYYTKAEIDEMLKGVLDPEQIKEILDQMFEEYIEGGELEQLIINAIAGLYTNEEIDNMLEELEARMKTWTGEQGYLKDITLTINGTPLHNNGSIVIEGGDVGNKLDITAFTQAMQNETARTESTYAKKSEIPSLQGYATQDWVADQNYLKDITLTINGTPLHNNGDIIIEGGGGEPVDISGKLDTTAYTQGMAVETARTENIYAKITDLNNKLDTTAFTEFRNEMEGCCSNVNDKIVDLFALIEDLQSQIDSITGDTPTPPTPDTGSTSYVLTTKYNVTSTSTPVKLLYKTTGLKSIKLDDGTTISPTKEYTFNSTGIKTIQYNLKYDYLPAQLFSGCTSLVEIVIPEGIKGNKVLSAGTYEGHSFAKGCNHLTGATIPSTMVAVNVSFFKGCTSLNTIYSYASTAPSIPTGIPQNPFYGVSNTGTLYCPQGSNYSAWLSELPSGWTGSPTL